MRIQLIAFISLLISLGASAQEKPSSFSFVEIQGRNDNFQFNSNTIESYDKTKIQYYQFKPTIAPVAKLIFIHGGGVHSKLGYLQLAQTLREEYSIETILIDLRGHGLSGGKRGDSPKVNSLYRDINEIIQLVKRDSNLPIYLGGHSSGGGLVLNYSQWKKKENISGYIFISPELGYKSDTEREERIPFAKVEIWKFVLNGMSCGLLMQHSDVVYFNYPQNVLDRNPLIVRSISVNMSKALTPNNPVKQFQNISQPVAIFVGENDELFEPKKVIKYASLPLSKDERSNTKIIPDQNHLSILNVIGSEIGDVILNWNK
ncbi:MAG: lysophospholipase [Bacteroidetes bacterium]|nr:MAG: lysophospholipase [Bacteroidota bacterium]